jgi:hypothetical protein
VNDDKGRLDNVEDPRKSELQKQPNSRARKRKTTEVPPFEEPTPKKGSEEVEDSFHFLQVDLLD